MLLTPFKVGIAGLGTVGSSVIHILERRANALARATGRNIQITGISARAQDKERSFAVKNYRWFDNPVELAKSSDIDVFVEAIGGENGIALKSINAALDAGKSVVTANKALLANNGMILAKRAEEKNLILNFEAVVAGGIPIIKHLREALIGNTIEKIYGILNGTCNYILSRMGDEHLSFNEALAAAQKKGYAEQDPSVDIDGHDTAHKLAVLATLAFGIKLRPAAVHHEGIRKIRVEDIIEARSLGYEIKLLGIAERRSGKMLLRVHPALLPQRAPLAQVHGVLNAVSIKADAVDLTSIGPGAGGEATASAVVADIADIARGHGLKMPLLRSIDDLEDFEVLPIAEHRGAFYVRMLVEDKVGVLANIAGEMARQEISLESVKQIEFKNRSYVDEHSADEKSIVIITHDTSEIRLRYAINAIIGHQFIRSEPRVLRIES
jgi:homoserine dehydrogenase